MLQYLIEKNIRHSGLHGSASKTSRMLAGLSLLCFFSFLLPWHHPGTACAAQAASARTPSAVNENLSQDPRDPDYKETPKAVRLTIRDALYHSFRGNQDIRISAFNPKQAREDLADAQSTYDASVFIVGSHDRFVDPESDIEDLTVKDETNFKAGVKKLLNSGGTLSLFLETQRFDKTYDPFDFKSRYATGPAFELKQPLLKNIGAKAEKAAIQIQNNNVNISEAQFQQTVNDTVAQVSQVYWRLFMYREILDINRDTLDMAEEVLRREVVRLAEGLSKPMDVARARSVAEARRAEVFRSLERVRVVTDQLKYLLNWSDLTIDSDYGIIPIEAPRTAPEEVSSAAAIKNGLKNRPEIKRAKNQKEIAKVQEDLSRHQRLPKLNAFLSYGLNGYDRQLSDAFRAVDLDDRNSWTVGLEFEAPLGNRSAEAGYRKQKLVRKQAGIALQQAADQIRLEVKAAVWAIELAKDEIQSTSLEMTEAKRVVEGEFERFELGQMTNEELFRAQDFLGNARRNHTQAVAGYNIALADLDRAQGILPHGLRIENTSEQGSAIEP